MKLFEGVSGALRVAFESDATVLITGSTGTGKTSLAKEIHAAGLRRAKPFVAINLATLHEGTLESELFGHERGSFTGAEQRRLGKLESAQGGTVFLDEVGELTPRLQARLLEFLHSRKISPVGSNREIKLDVRIIAATHKSLERSVQRGEFREDLFHRLRVVSVHLKPLRERWEDFDYLVHACLEEVCRIHQRSILKITENTAQKLENYLWPGNIRELRNVLEYAVLSANRLEITENDLPAWFTSSLESQKECLGLDEQALGVAEVKLSLNYQESRARFEKEFLTRALSFCHGKINHTARQTCLNKATLIRRMRMYGLCRPKTPA